MVSASSRARIRSEQRFLRARSLRREAEVPVRLRRRNATAWRALQESVLDEEGLVHFFDRVRVLADCRADRVESDRTALELLDDRLDDSRVHVVEAERID